VASVAALAGSPQQYAGGVVVVYGMLRNAGTNYFTDLDLVLEDWGGAKIPVRPWVPLEVPPPRLQEERERPHVLSDFLNKTLLLKGRLVEQKEEGEPIFALEVLSAIVVGGAEEEK
jgi:hypothetical protein